MVRIIVDERSLTKRINGVSEIIPISHLHTLLSDTEQIIRIKLICIALGCDLVEVVPVKGIRRMAITREY